MLAIWSSQPGNACQACMGTAESPVSTDSVSLACLAGNKYGRRLLRNCNLLQTLSPHVVELELDRWSAAIPKGIQSMGLAELTALTSLRINFEDVECKAPIHLPACLSALCSLQRLNLVLKYTRPRQVPPRVHLPQQEGLAYLQLTILRLRRAEVDEASLGCLPNLKASHSCIWP